MHVTMENLQNGLRLASEEVVAFLRSEPDVHALTRGGVWTVRETAVHLIAGTRMYTWSANGHPFPLNSAVDLAASNQGAFFALHEDRPAVLAHLFEDAVKSLLNAIEERSSDDLCSWYSEVGGQSPVGTMIAALLVEYLLHGADMAFALGREWRCPESAADTAFAAITPFILPLHFDSRAANDLDASFGLERPDCRFSYRVRSGRLEPLNQQTDTDCSMSGSSSQWLLWLGGRAEWGDVRLTASGNRAELAQPFAGNLFGPCEFYCAPRAVTAKSDATALVGNVHRPR
jgi:uncharacterized protein (TIGR03083 family)